MQDPNVPFADTSARRAQLQEATEQYKSSIEDNVQSLKGDAKEVGKTVAFVAGVGVAVYLIADAILPKSNEYRYAEKYGELDDEDDDNDDDDNYRTNFVGEHEESDAKHLTPKSNKQLTKEIKEQPKKSAIVGMIGGLVTSLLTNLAKQQVSEYLSRLRQNNATNRSTASPSTGYQGSSPASGYTNPY